MNYRHCVQRNFRFAITKGVYAMPVAKENGFLLISKNMKYEIVQHTGEDTYECSCESEYMYPASETCFHVNAAKHYWLRFDFQNQETEVFKREKYRILQETPVKLYATYCDTNNSYGIIKETDKTLKCLVCRSNVSNCIHMKDFKKKAATDLADLRARAAEAQDFSSVSEEKIPYPLNAGDKALFRSYLCGRPYPTHLIPEYSASRKCKCGHLFRDEDPTVLNWIQSKEASIHLAHTSLKCIVYYRPTTGNCECRQQYDGRRELLINLDNIHIFSYSWLFEILHHTQESAHPIRAAFNSANRTREICSDGIMLDWMYKKLRMSYNVFIRLLDLGYPSNFRCAQCVDEGIKIIICDGICMGCFKERMASNEEPQAPPGIVIKESGVKDRVFLNNVKARELLSIYSSDKDEVLSAEDFNKLKYALSTTPSLQALIENASNPCPPSLKKLLRQLSLNNPTCGILQIAGDNASGALNAIQEMVNGDFSRLQHHNELLRKYAPMLIEFVSSKDVSQQHISNLLRDLLASIAHSFRASLPSDDSYGVPATVDDMKLVFFPTNPPCRGITFYEADKRREAEKKKAESHGCNKESKKHNALSPGVFTMVCQHGVCIAFELMDSPESPAVPFRMLMRHFEEMPDVVIYDNSCHLHLYALKREPARFKNVRFMIDRLHWKTHKCTEGYSMTSYAADPLIKNVNSQACEQLNSDLRKLSIPVSGMPSENAKHHISVFLALRNIDKNVTYLNLKRVDE